MGQVCATGLAVSSADTILVEEMMTHIDATSLVQDLVKAVPQVSYKRCYRRT